MTYLPSFRSLWNKTLHVPLKMRFVKGLGLMLLPLLLLGGGSLMALHMMERSLATLSDEIRHEMALIDRTELQTVRCSASATRFLLTGTQQDRKRLADQITVLDDAFAALVTIAFGQPEESALIQEAYQLWQENRAIGLALVAAPVTVEQMGSPALQDFSSRLEKMLEFLDRAHRLGDREIGEEIEEFEAVRRLILGLISVVFVVGLLLAVGSALVLAHSILQPVKVLKSAAAALRAGELATRVQPLGRGELADLMESFNAMAADLQQKQRQLAELAITDPLTGLFNRREFMQQLTAELERAGRYGHPVVLLMCDLDHFKQVNDSYGHQAGDQVLQSFARTLRDQLRQGDLVARYGGEEFIALLPETSLEASLVSAERIRLAVAALPVDTTSGPVSLTVSIGCAEFPRNGATGETVLAAADRALYRAKEAGRNRIGLPAG